MFIFLTIVAADHWPDGAEPAADPGAERGGRDWAGAQGPDTEAGKPPCSSYEQSLEK